jgi:protein-tyrosine phosphatase
VIRILNVTPAKEAGITAGVPNYFENSCSEIKYKRISVYDSASSDLLSHADEMVEFISSGLHHGGVLVHCQKGVSRSATAVIMFLMR